VCKVDIANFIDSGQHYDAQRGEGWLAPNPPEHVEPIDRRHFGV
jgi:hypothetical protein